MGGRGWLRYGLIALCLAGFAVACEGEAERTFYNDIDATDGTASGDVMQGGGDSAEDAGGDGGSAIDATTGPTGDGAHEGGDDSSGEDGETHVDAGRDAARDAGTDAAPEAEAGCGPLDTVTNCGACGTSCDSTHSHGAECNGSDCTYTGCATGYGDCDAGPPNTNGCETAITTPTNCTGCGIACDTSHSQGASCDTTGCTYTGCASGYKDCTTTAPDSNGCETPITTTTNCGGCGVTCGTLNVATANCTSGTACGYTCSTGYSNCNTSGSNTTGCECSTPGCCGANCEDVHTNGPASIGLGNTWDDCVADGTYNVTQATAACVAWKGTGGCSGGWTCTTPTHMVVAQDTICDNACTMCWSYQTVGGVYPTTAGTVTDCDCPGTVLGNWQ
ncbi:MAG: hypothetical protein ACLP1X_21115 [Polyangiaceae bacterium]|jgi:hypothetical protein